MRYTLLSAVLLLTLSAASCVWGIGVAAGTKIQLIAEAHYSDTWDQIHQADPAVAELTVLQVAGVQIIQDPAAGAAVLGEALYIPVQIHNTGNGNDSFDLISYSSKGWATAVIRDGDADGAHDSDEIAEITNTQLIAADGYVACFLKVVVPATAQSGDTVSLLASSDLDPVRGSDLLHYTYTVPEPPTVVIESPSGAELNTVFPTASISGTASCDEGLATVAWSTDRGASGTCTGTTDWSAANVPLQPGQNTVTVTATDPHGRTGSANVTVTYNEPGAPTISISNPTSDPTYATDQATLSIGGTASDQAALTQVTWANDRGGSGTCTGTTSWTANAIPLCAGQNLITVTATNLVGKTASDVLTVTRTVDAETPTVQIVLPTAEPTLTTNQETIDLEGTVADDGEVASVAWANDQGGSGACIGTTSWTVAGVALSAGQNVITITATDKSGKSGTDAIIVTRIVDATHPTVQITSPTDQATYSTTSETVMLSGVAQDDIGLTVVTWANSNGGSGACVGAQDWSTGSIPLVPGQNVISVTATDTSGNTGTDVLTITRIADVANPTITITSPTSSTTYSTTASSVTLAGTASDDMGIASVAWTNSSGGSGTCTGTASWSVANLALQPGENIITVTATDTAGKKGTDVITVTRAMPAVAPIIHITSPTSATSCARNCAFVNLGGTATDDGTVASVTWANTDTGQSGNCTLVGSAWTAEGIDLVEGDNVINVTATDAASSSSTATLTVTYIDAVPGSAWIGTAMISLPIIPDSTDPKPVVGFSDDNWFAFNTSLNAYAGYADLFSWFDPQDATPGRGFWASFDGSAGAPYGTILPQDQPATIHLEQGWNLIGTPFITSIAWDEDAMLVSVDGQSWLPLGQASSVVAAFAWGWVQDPEDPFNGWYTLVCDDSVAGVAEHALEPWRGYWLRAYRECDLKLTPAPN